MAQFKIDTRVPDIKPLLVKDISLNAANIIIANRNLFRSDIEQQNDFTNKRSMLGTLVHDNIEIPQGSWIDSKGTVINYDALRIDECLISVNLTRNIIKTAVQGLNGTIKEYISDGDYTINIDGYISGRTEQSGDVLTVKDIGNRYPQEDISTFKDILKIEGSFKIVSCFLQRFNITEIIIESGTIEQEEGNRSRQKFSLSCLSDKKIELENV